MDHLSAIRTFVEIADQGSLTRAAETLDLSRAMVSRHLEGLERWLGARLLHRTTRRVSLSEAGTEALPRLRQMLELAADLQAVSGARRAEPTGKLRITTSLSFAVSCLTQAIVEFQRRYPRIEIELVTVDRAVDLVGERIDLAVRITNRLDDGVVARRLASCRSVLCASPAYLKRRGRPERPEDLKSHECITHAFGTRAEYRASPRRPGDDAWASRARCRATKPRCCGRPRSQAPASRCCPPTSSATISRAGRWCGCCRTTSPSRWASTRCTCRASTSPCRLKLLIDFLAERFGGDIAPWDRQPTATQRGAARAARP